MNISQSEICSYINMDVELYKKFGKLDLSSEEEKHFSFEKIERIFDILPINKEWIKDESPYLLNQNIKNMTLNLKNSKDTILLFSSVYKPEIYLRFIKNKNTLKRLLTFIPSVEFIVKEGNSTIKIQTNYFENVQEMKNFCYLFNKLKSMKVDMTYGISEDSLLYIPKKYYLLKNTFIVEKPITSSLQAKFAL